MPQNPNNPMNRRECLRAGAAVSLAGLFTTRQDDPPPAPKPTIVSVDGPISAVNLGIALSHEHVMVDFIGADQASPERYDRSEVERVVLPHLQRAKALGCACLFECTPAYLGRDPILLQRLAKASGLRIVTNTGYYAAGGGKYLPVHASRESPDQLAARWLNEAHNGIDDTGIRPGFIKIGVDAGPLNEVAKKIVKAAARTHRHSGLTIAAHTGNGEAAAEQLEILVAEGIDPSAWIWVHAQNENEAAVHVGVADLGGWVSLDGVSPQTIDQHILLLDAMRKANFLHKVLISQDAGWFHVGEPGGGTFRPYDTLFTTFIPALKMKGYSDEEINMLISENPSRAFRVARRVADDGLLGDPAAPA